MAIFAQDADVIAHLESNYGVILPGLECIMPQSFASNFNLALDAQSPMQTAINAGVPAMLSSFIDNKTITVLTQPNAASTLFDGEMQSGTWVTTTTYFMVVEQVGEVAAYGDRSTGGMAGINTNYPQRDSYHFQCIATWGAQQMDRAGLQKLNYAAAVRAAAVAVLQKGMNVMYFNGVAGLRNYGILNDPNLPAPITPKAKQLGGFTWANGTAEEIYQDFMKIFKQAQTQSGGMVTMEMPMRFNMPSICATELLKTNSLTSQTSVMDMLKKAFPKCEIRTASEFSTGGGNLLQLVIPELQTQEVGQPAFTEKLRGHNIVTGLSDWQQKQSSGGWGMVYRNPFLVTSMLGI